jgi:hypothetical protein
MNIEAGSIKFGITYKASAASPENLSGKTPETMNIAVRLSTAPINKLPSKQHTKMKALTSLIAHY